MSPSAGLPTCLRPALLPCPAICTQAPEILDGGRASTASDVYAFGLVLWELATWQLPWSTASGEHLPLFTVSRTE